MCKIGLADCPNRSEITLFAARSGCLKARGTGSSPAGSHWLAAFICLLNASSNTWRFSILIIDHDGDFPLDIVHEMSESRKAMASLITRNCSISGFHLADGSETGDRPEVQLRMVDGACIRHSHLPRVSGYRPLSEQSPGFSYRGASIAYWPVLVHRLEIASSPPVNCEACYLPAVASIAFKYTVLRRVTDRSLNSPLESCSPPKSNSPPRRPLFSPLHFRQPSSFHQLLTTCYTEEDVAARHVICRC